MNLDILRQHKSELEAELRTIHDAAGEASLNRDQQNRWDVADAELREVNQALDAALGAQRRLDTLAEHRKRWGSLQVGGFGATAGGPWADVDGNILMRETPAGFASRAHDVLERAEDLSDAARERLAEAVDAPNGGAAAQLVLARSNPDYASAFEKVLRNPERAFLTFTQREAAAFAAVESTRASLSLSTGSAGYTVPLAFDPNLAAIVNDGVANPFRAVSTLKTTISSPHRAVTSPGITASWVAEGVAFGDASPTFSAVDVPLFKLAAYVSASYEVLEDGGQTIRESLPVLLADARDRAEGAAFATGNGTTAPKGIVTALAAASAFVTATTRGSFTSASIVDTLAVLNAIPVRARQSRKAAWIMNNVTRMTISQQVIGTTGVLLSEMLASDTILGVKSFEVSAMTATTTSGNYLAVLADFSKYLIVDSLLGPTLQYVPVVFDPTAGTPTGQAGWVYHQRTGADHLDTTQGRILKM